MGGRLINYLDDFLFLVSDSQSTAHRQLVLDTFKSAGLAINESKSLLQFTCLLTHLGFVIDLDSGSFEVPLERWESLQQLITVALSRQKVLVHLLSRIAGHLSSMILAIGPIALIKSRQCHSYVPLSPLSLLRQSILFMAGKSGRGDHGRGGGRGRGGAQPGSNVVVIDALPPPPPSRPRTRSRGGDDGYMHEEVDITPEDPDGENGNDHVYGTDDVPEPDTRPA